MFVFLLSDGGLAAIIVASFPNSRASSATAGPYAELELAPNSNWARFHQPTTPQHTHTHGHAHPALSVSNQSCRAKQSESAGKTAGAGARPPFSAIGGPARASKSLDYSPHNERPGSAGSASLFPPSLPHTQTAALLLKSCSALFGFLLPAVTFASAAALGDYGKEAEARLGSQTRRRARSWFSATRGG